MKSNVIATIISSKEGCNMLRLTLLIQDIKTWKPEQIKKVLNAIDGLAETFDLDSSKMLDAILELKLGKSRKN
jgi:hypothetical protein